MRPASASASHLVLLGRRFETPGYAIVYGGLTATGIGALVLAHTLPFRLFCASVAAAYLISQSLFIAVHLTLHRIFAELKPSGWRGLGVGPLMAHTHHTKGGRRVFAEAWLLYRLAYFVDIDQAGRSPWHGGIAAHIQLVHLAATLWWLGPTRLAWTVWGLTLGAHNLQAVVHEWYHVRRNERSDRFLPPTLLLMDLLEHVGLVSLVGHRRHHKHDDDSEATVALFDIRPPPGADRAAEAFYRLMTWLGRDGRSTVPVCRLLLAAAHAGVLVGCLAGISRCR